MGSPDDKNKVSIINKKVKGEDIKLHLLVTIRDETAAHIVYALRMQMNFLLTLRAKADLKILMIHTMSNQEKLLEVGTRFIKESGGDVVFGSGPTSMETNKIC